MSTQPDPAAMAQTTSPTRPEEVRVYSHSALYYWWPVWLLGLILGGLTWWGGERMYVFPGDAVPKRSWEVSKEKDKKEVMEGVLMERSDNLRKRLPPNQTAKDVEDNEPHKGLHSTSQRSFGVIFAIVLLVVIFITNVPLRGMWSVLIIVTIIMLSIIFALAGIWDDILSAIKVLDIRLNMGGYFFISLGLLILWVFAFYFFDRQIYITFVPGAMKVNLEIGAGEKQYDTFGMTIERERSDFFRHRILGLGSGDLILRTTGADRHEFRLPNVLFINRKVKLIEDMMRVRQERGM